MRVLIVEDEIHLAQSIQQLLKQHQIQSDMTHDGKEAIEFIVSQAYDVIILDVMLPEMDGFRVVKEIRSQGISTPVLFLTAKDTIEDIVIGLSSGGDDYMSKPFHTNELVARLHALARRKSEIALNQFEYRKLILNQNNHQLSFNDKSIQLPHKEYEIMELLMSHPGAVYSKEQILMRVWGLESDIEESNVETYISFLRKKLTYLKSGVTIQTIRKLGYTLGTRHD